MQAATSETPDDRNPLPFRGAAVGRRAVSIDPRLVSIASLLLFLLLWELAADVRLADPFFISSPSRIVAVGVQLGGDPDFWRDVDVSSTEFLIGYGAAIAIGIPLGVATAWYRRLNYLVGPFIDVLNVVPRISFLPIIVIWFGILIWSK